MSPYDGLRSTVFDLDPAGQPQRSWLWGAVLETTFEDGEGHTLVCLADGTVTLFTSDGGACEARSVEPVRAAAARFLDVVESSLALFGPDGDDARPDVGNVVLRALACSGRLRADGVELLLAAGEGGLAPVWAAGHAVVRGVYDSGAWPGVPV